VEPRRRESTATSNADKTLTNNLVGLLAINASSFAHSHVCGVGRVGQVNLAVSGLWSEDALLGERDVSSPAIGGENSPLRQRTQ
jgi:hypothetical protein